MFKSNVSRALQLACVAMLIAPVHAGTLTAHMGVSVTVVRPARVLVRTESLPSELEISTADVKRGYIRLRRATHLTIGNSALAVPALEVSSTVPIFSQLTISANGQRATTLGMDGGEVSGWRDSGSGGDLVLDLRLKLLPGVKPGRYPWPVHFEVRLDY